MRYFNLTVFVVCGVFFNNVDSVLRAKRALSDDGQGTNQQSSSQDSSAEDALLLTPLIEGGKTSDAILMSKVSPDISGTTSFSGFFTVNKSCDNNLFFWLFPAETDWEKKPTLLWLQGGPGITSMVGLFEETGPLRVVNGKIVKRDVSWNKNVNVIYMDQPANTGFSYSGKGCYVNSDRQCAVEVYSALLQLFTMFTKLAANKFYIAGDSYAAHFIPHVGKVIVENNQKAPTKIQLTATMIGNPFIDAVENLNWAQMLRNIGLIDTKERKQLEADFNKYASISRNPKSYQDKYLAWQDYLLAIYYATRGVNLYNFLAPNVNENWFGFVPALTHSDTRKAIHVGNRNFNLDHDWKVYDALLPDYLSPATSLWQECLELFPIIVYVGQLDITCGYPMVANILESLKWSASDKFLAADRQRWCINDQLVGFWRGAGNLHEVLIRNASHLAPQSQPEWCWTLLNSVTSSPKENPLQGLAQCESEDSS